MYYIRRDGIRVYPRLRWLPLMLLWWTALASAWLAMWCAVWCWEVYTTAPVRAARTTSRIFGWTR